MLCSVDEGIGAGLEEESLPLWYLKSERGGVEDLGLSRLHALLPLRWELVSGLVISSKVSGMSGIHRFNPPGTRRQRQMHRTHAPENEIE